MKRLALLLVLGLTACGGGNSAQKSIVHIDPQSFTLTVTVAGSGSVSSSPAGISCPGACSASYVSGTSIVLTETPASGNSFSAWSNGCSGTASTCALSMNADEMPTATFAKKTPPPPPVASQWRFLICTTDGSQQAYVIDTNLDVNGNSVSEIVYPLSPATGCTFPEANAQQELGPTAVASTIYFGGVLPIAPVGDNFKFTITQGGTTATYSALCVFDPTGGCEGNIDGSTVAFVDGSEYFWNALYPPAGETYTGLLNGVNATITLTQAPNSQTVVGTYQDGIESYSFTGNGYGDSVLVTLQAGGAKTINYFTFDGGPTGHVFFYGFDGSYLGTMQPPGFQ